MQNARVEFAQEPFLFRFKETEDAVLTRSPIATPETGGESNPIEEEPKPEPTTPTPWGD